MNTFISESILAETRRQFFSRGARGLGTMALASLLQGDAAAAPANIATRDEEVSSGMKSDSSSVHPAAQRECAPTCTRRGNPAASARIQPQFHTFVRRHGGC